MIQYIIKTIYYSQNYSSYYSPSVKVIFSFLDQRQTTSSSNYFSFNTFNNKTTNNSQANSQYQSEFKPNASYPKFINTKNMKFPPL